jgi:hypothetical protein
MPELAAQQHPGFPPQRYVGRRVEPVAVIDPRSGEVVSGSIRGEIAPRET